MDALSPMRNDPEPRFKRAYDLYRTPLPCLWYSDSRTYDGSRGLVHYSGRMYYLKGPARENVLFLPKNDDVHEDYFS